MTADVATRALHRDGKHRVGLRLHKSCDSQLIIQRFRTRKLPHRNLITRLVQVSRSYGSHGAAAVAQMYAFALLKVHGTLVAGDPLSTLPELPYECLGSGTLH
jgi:hypothetical protein